MAKHEQGFTIVEMMIATSVFSIVLLVVSAGAISLARQHTKGIIANNTQNITRSAMNEVSQAIQFSSGGVATLTTPTGTKYGYCINGKPYYFVLGKQLNGNSINKSKHVLVTSHSACSTTQPNLNRDFSAMTDIGSEPRELLGDRMRLVKFDVVQSGTMYNLSMRVAYGDDDLLCAPSFDTCEDYYDEDLMQFLWFSPTLLGDVKCRGAVGNQFCYVSDVSTTIKGRL